MPIYAESTGTSFAPMEAGAYAARCYSMIQIGTNLENIKGEDKLLHKVKLSFEFPTEQKVFKEENGEQPYVISIDFTLSLAEKANLRKFLESWRGKGFTEEEAKKFDIAILLGKQCLINVIHKVAKNGNTYAQISSVSPLPKGMTCPAQINKSVLLSYDDFDYTVYESLPDYIKDKIKTSKEFKALGSPNEMHSQEAETFTNEQDLPF